MDKKTARLRRAKKTRSHIRRLGVARLTVHRSGRHIYAQVIAAQGGGVIAAASTVQKDLRSGLTSTSNKDAAKAANIIKNHKIDPKMVPQVRERLNKNMVRYFHKNHGWEGT